MCWNAKYALLMLFSTAVTFVCSLLIEAVKQTDWNISKKVKYKKLLLSLSLVLNLFVLGYFKYTNFALDLVSKAFALLHIHPHIPSFDIVLPVGISFYTFQALSYTIDVYRDEIYAEKNFFRYALFVSFFPQLVAGPIERSKNLLRQLATSRTFSFTKARQGLLLMLWGYFLKLVIADKIALFVDVVYKGYIDFNGLVLLIATVLFAFQIYCDFYGYSIIAKGAAKILGIELMENFTAPYLSFSVAEFWRNWHISLTSWFKDYLYIPLGGSRKGKIRKYINKLIVFLVSGLWHGAGLSFIAWGFLNGIYQVIGEILQPFRDSLATRLRINNKNVLYKTAQILITFTLVDFSWIFFRADSITTAVQIIGRIAAIEKTQIEDIFHHLRMAGMYQPDIIMLIISLSVLLIADIFKRSQKHISEEITRLPWWIQSLVIVTVICIILVFGVWGPAYNQSNFIYFQF